MFRPRLLVLHVLVTSLLLTLLGRLWFVQNVEGAEYAKAAAETRIRTVALPPVRGQILDVAGTPLVTNQTVPVVSVDYMTLLHQPDGGRAVLARLAEALHRPYQEIADRARLCTREVPRPCWPGSPYQPIPVTDQVDVRTAMQIVERQEEFPGVSTRLQPVRQYPLGTAAAQTLGYLQPATRGELPEDLAHFSGVTQVGRDGLEAEYDAELAGRPGLREVIVDSGGRVTQVVREDAAQTGDNLVTSIDARVQVVAERALTDAVAKARAQGKTADAGAAVVLEARTGRVVALAGNPTYDPSVWTGGISQSDYKALLGKGKPLVSRAVQGEWAPGSTWKIVSTAAAAAAGYSLDATYDCPGSYTVGGRAFRNFEAASLGLMTMHKALVKSCDTIFYRFAEEMWRADGGLHPVANPRDWMQTMARRFGFGVRTGVDLPNESAGRVPDRAWKLARWKSTRESDCAHAKTGYPGVADQARAAYLRALAAENCRGGAVWWAGDAANFSIGQGDVLTTPLQLARAYAALANGGTVFSPRIGKAVTRPDGTVVRTITPPVTGRIPVSGQVLDFIRRALAEVPKTGTAAKAFDGFPFSRISVAGKTGTAEAYGKEDTSWFASFAPARNPQYVVVVMVSRAGKGADVAAPAARRIWEGIYGLKDAK